MINEYLKSYENDVILEIQTESESLIPSINPKVHVLPKYILHFSAIDFNTLRTINDERRNLELIFFFFFHLYTQNINIIKYVSTEIRYHFLFFFLHQIHWFGSMIIRNF